MMPCKSGFEWLIAGLLLAGTAVAADLPVCLTRAADETPRAAVMKVQPTDEELLARLAYAEGRSTGFADDPRLRVIVLSEQIFIAHSDFASANKVVVGFALARTAAAAPE